MNQINKHLKKKKKRLRGFPGGSVVKNPPNARDTGSVPNPGGPHMLRSNVAHAHSYWSPCALEPTFHNKGSGCNENPRALQLKDRPLIGQLEKALGQQRRPSRAKNEYTNFCFKDFIIFQFVDERDCWLLESSGLAEMWFGLFSG